MQVEIIILTEQKWTWSSGDEMLLYEMASIFPCENMHENAASRLNTPDNTDQDQVQPGKKTFQNIVYTCDMSIEWLEDI